MTELVERVAMVLCEDHWQDDPQLEVVQWDDLASVEQDAWRRSARAAIAAIQGDHPTPQDLLNKAEAERDRAREELARVREMGEALAHEMERCADVTERWNHSLASQVNEIARQALAAWNAGR